MTILAFWQVGNAGFERGDLDCISHEEAFEKLWWNRDDLCARFYDVESFIGDDAYGLHNYIGNADDFEMDYNDEVLDGGWWCKALLIPSDEVKGIILGNKEKFSVYVGGDEVNSFYLSREEAEAMAAYWRGQGYDDVQIVDMSKS